MNHIQLECLLIFSEYFLKLTQDNIKYFIDLHVGALFEHITNNKI
jgi:hypothetical protein